MRESNLQRQIIQYLRSQGDYVFKVVGSPMQQRGTPDLLVCHQGLFVAIECKIPGEHLSKLQEVESRKVRQAGGLSLEVSSLESVKYFMALADSNWVKAHPWNIAGQEIKAEDLIPNERY